jgi:ribonuclease E
VKAEATSELAGEAAPAATSEAAPAKADNKRPARPRKPKVEVKPVDLAAVGLQLVETKADAPKASPSEEFKPKVPRKAANWQKNAKEDASAEPLVMVETQNKS